MTPIDSRFPATSVKAPKASKAPVAPPSAAPAPAVARDAFVSSAGAPAEQLRALSRELTAILAVSPRTTAQAEAWQARSLAARTKLDGLLESGALKALPLKERSALLSASKRLDALIEDLPGIIRFIGGKPD
jgi:hypothetical protein